MLAKLLTMLNQLMHYMYNLGCYSITRAVLKSGAGYAQVKAGTSDIRYFSSYGDDPRDQARIVQGISIYNKWHKK